MGLDVQRDEVGFDAKRRSQRRLQHHQQQEEPQNQDHCDDRHGHGGQHLLNRLLAGGLAGEAGAAIHQHAQNGIVAARHRRPERRPVAHRRRGEPGRDARPPRRAGGAP